MKKYYIGVDIGGTNSRVALVSDRFNIIERSSLATKSYGSPKALIQAVCSTILSALRKKDITSGNIIGIGIGIAGQVDFPRGIVRNLTNVPGWKNVALKGLIERRLFIPAYVDNDVNVMALAEFYKGAGRGCRNIVCVALGTGVGGGIIIDGKLYRGSTSTAGEIGHIPINEVGPRCNCGGRACIESYIGARYLTRDLGGLTPEEAYRAARRGDRRARRFWEKTAVRLGIMLSGVINLLNPDRVVIGGGVAQAGGFLFKPLKATIKRRAMPLQATRVKIVKAALGTDAGIIGAAILASLERDK